MALIAGSDNAWELVAGHVRMFGRKKSQGTIFDVARQRTEGLAVNEYCDDRRLLGSITQAVLLSDDILLKQAISRTGENFTLADYWRVQPTIQTARIVALDAKKGNIYTVYGRGDTLYLAVLKRIGGREIYLQAFRRARPREVRAVINNPHMQIPKNE